MTFPGHPLFNGLFDDAALFPPGDAPMAIAVPAHTQLGQRLGPLVGPFIVPAARLDELFATLTPDHLLLDACLIARAEELPAAVARCASVPNLNLAAVEVPMVDTARSALATLLVLSETVPAMRTAVELPRTPARTAVLDVLAGTGHRAKLRTGGLRADQFPDEDELAHTILDCADRLVPFKCTAGMHHAVRHTDAATGFEHHGFLNVCLAVAAATRNATSSTVSDLLAERDSSVIASEVSSWSADDTYRVRSLFTSFGTCSIDEPVEDLVTLGLLSTTEEIAQ